MSVLVKGMEMPKDGKRPLWAVIHSDGVVEYNIGDYGWQTTNAIEVPTPHGRLGDLDKLYKWVKAECNPYGKPTIGKEDGMKVIEIIKACHTVIEAEVEE